MGELKRFDGKRYHLQQTDDGEYVRYSQYEKLQSDLCKEYIVSDNLGKIADSQTEKIVEMEAQIETLQEELRNEVTRLSCIIEDHIDRMSWMLRETGILGADEIPGIYWARPVTCLIDKDKVSEALTQKDQQVRDEALEKAADNAPDDASERYLRSLISI